MADYGTSLFYGWCTTYVEQNISINQSNKNYLKWEALRLHCSSSNSAKKFASLWNIWT
jgi:hypothetical protein